MTNIELFKKILESCAVTVVDYSNWEDGDELVVASYLSILQYLGYRVMKEHGTFNFNSHYFGKGINDYYFIIRNNEVMLKGWFGNLNHINVNDFNILYRHLIKKNEHNLEELLEYFK
jgi:hypothetical protein